MRDLGRRAGELGNGLDGLSSVGPDVVRSDLGCEKVSNGGQTTQSGSMKPDDRSDCLVTRHCVWERGTPAVPALPTPHTHT